MKSRAVYAILVVFVLLVSCRFGQIIGQDEISHYYKCPRILYLEGYAHPETIITFSPHLYPLTACVVCKLLGRFNVSAMQATGLFCWLGCLVLMWRIARNHHERVLACMLCASMPAVVQAAVTIEIDQTVLPLATLVLCWRVERFCEDNTWKNALWLAVAMCVALWGRLTTPLVLLPLLVGAAWLRVSWRRGAATAAVLLAGVLMFLGTWFVYCRMTGVEFAGPFNYLAISFQETTTGNRASGVSRLVQNWLYVMFWGVNPLLLGLCLWRLTGMWRFWRREHRLPARAVYLLAGLWLLLGYSVVGGALFGFPKYQMPAMALLCLGIAEQMENQGNAKAHAVWLVMACVAVMCLQLLLGDPLLTLRAEIRDLGAQGLSIRHSLMVMAAKAFVLWGAMLVSVWSLWRFKHLPWTWVAVCCVISANGAFAVWQGNSGYSTGYIYGDKGETQEVAAIIRQNGWQERRLLAPHEVLFQVGDFQLVNDIPLDFGNLDSILEIIEQENPPLIALSPLINQLPQIQAWRQCEKLQKILRERYEFREFGRYMTWTLRPVR